MDSDTSTKKPLLKVEKPAKNKEAESFDRKWIMTVSHALMLIPEREKRAYWAKKIILCKSIRKAARIVEEIRGRYAEKIKGGSMSNEAEQKEPVEAETPAPNAEAPGSGEAVSPADVAGAEQGQ